MKKNNNYKNDADRMLSTFLKYIKGELNQKEASKELHCFGFSKKNISTVLNKTERRNVIDFKKYKVTE